MYVYATGRAHEGTPLQGSEPTAGLSTHITCQPRASREWEITVHRLPACSGHVLEALERIWWMFKFVCAWRAQGSSAPCIRERHQLIQVGFIQIYHRNVGVGSIPDGVLGIFHWPNPSSHTMALETTQPLTETSTRCLSWGVKATGVSLSRNSGSFNLLETRPVQGCTGIVLPLSERRIIS